MAFLPPPKESKNQINKAGAILANKIRQSDQLAAALELANRWRACHAYPINTFQATLRRNINKYKNPIVAQRLKRMPTIIDKLRRYHAMKLTTMQDIGGLRAVLSNVIDANELAENYRTNKRLTHELIEEYNYIENPRSEDGYRSIHLIYKYRNKRNPAYDGLRLELQIRSKLQHTWATAVETMGTFLGQALKSRQGDQEWLDFFAIVSSAFAYKEHTPLVPRFNHLSYEETLKAVVDAESRLGVLEKMKGFSVAVRAIPTKNKGWSYHLIILNSLKRTVQIIPYNRENFSQALDEYSKAESEAANGAKIEPVLVSVGPIKTLRRAYPNFFLDIKDFVHRVEELILEASKI